MTATIATPETVDQTAEQEDVILITEAGMEVLRTAPVVPLATPRVFGATEQPKVVQWEDQEGASRGKLC